MNTFSFGGNRGRMTLVAPVLWTCAFGSAGCADTETRYWLGNMVCDHDYTDEEIATVLGVTGDDVPELLQKYGIDRESSPEKPRDFIRVVPYPGGRHPRIGFLDGAIDPHRDTKASVFLPWEDAGYVVVDVPEAIGSNKKIVYLAHTHVDTIWTEQNIELERLDWERRDRGELYSHRVFPNGMEFIARIIPGVERVDMELTLVNGTDAPLKKPLAQNCVLLKGAPDFNGQTNDNKKLLDSGFAATRSRDGRRWIVTHWDQSRAWANPPCPCMHSDPRFPDLQPGERATSRGWLLFYEGDDVESVLRDQ